MDVPIRKNSEFCTISFATCCGSVHKNNYIVLVKLNITLKHALPVHGGTTDNICIRNFVLQAELFGSRHCGKVGV